MNILIVTPWCYPFNNGGVSKIVDTISKGLIGKGHSIKTLIPIETHRFKEIEGTDIPTYFFYLPMFKFHSIRNIATYFLGFIPKLIQLLTFLNKHKIDIPIIVYPTTNSIYFYFLKLFFNKNYIVSFHGSDNHNFKSRTSTQKSILSKVIRNSYKVHAVSEALLTQVRNNINFDIEKGVVIHNGIDFSFDEPKKKSHLNFKYILSLASLLNVKGPDILIKAFLKLNLTNNVKLLMAGSGPMESELKSIEKKENLTNHVVFVGEILPKDIIPVIEDALFCVVPSRNEGLPLVVLEFGLLSKAVIASNVGGIPEVIANEESGLLFAKENSDQLAQLIKVLLEDEKYRNKLGKNLCMTVQKNFSKDIMIDRYNRLFLDYLDSNSKH